MIYVIAALIDWKSPFWKVEPGSGVKLDTSQKFYKRQIKLSTQFEWCIGGRLDGIYIDKEHPERSYIVEIKNINIPTPHPVRVKIAYSGFKNNTEQLTNMYLSTVNSIIDLRNNVKENIVFPRLALALSDKIYIKSLTNGQLWRNK